MRTSTTLRYRGLHVKQSRYTISRFLCQSITHEIVLH